MTQDYALRLTSGKLMSPLSSSHWNRSETSGEIHTGSRWLYLALMVLPDLRGIYRMAALAPRIPYPIPRHTLNLTIRV